MKPKQPKKPQDSTLRNVRAANKRIAKLEQQVQALHRAMSMLPQVCAYAGWDVTGERIREILSKGKK